MAKYKYSQTINESCYPDLEKYIDGTVSNGGLVINTKDWLDITFTENSGDSTEVTYFKITHANAPIQIKINDEPTTHDYWFQHANQGEIMFEDILIKKVSIRVIKTSSTYDSNSYSVKFLAMY